MGLRDLVFNGVKIADSITADLQDSVSIRRWIGVSTQSSKPSYASPIFFTGVVEEGISERRSPDGEVIVTKGSVMFVRQLPNLGVPGRREPLDPRDEVTLPSGTKGLIVDFEEAPVDPLTDKTYYIKIFIG